MRGTLHGTVAGPAAAVVGTWDPFMPEHRRLLDELTTDAHATGLSSVAIMLDPPPARFIRGGKAWPLYDDTATRLEVVRSCPVDAVLLVHLARRDIDATAADFLELVSAHIRLRELWLGSAQSLGPGPDGNPDAIARVARRRRFGIRTLEPFSMSTSQVRESLLAGRLAHAIQIVGRPPARRRPRAAQVRLDWPDGRYEAVPSTNAGEHAGTIAVEIRASRRGDPMLWWPDRQITRLAFIKGPADAAGVT